MKVGFDKVADFSTDRSGADLRYALNYEKIKLLGWSQKRDFSSSLPSIINYYKEELK